MQGQSDASPSMPSGPAKTRSFFWPVFVAVVVLCAAVPLGLWFVTVPYYATWPGPVKEVVDYISIEEGPTVHPLNGDLYLLTVSLQEVNVYGVVEGWLDPDVDLVGRWNIRPEGVTPEEYRQANLTAMERSMDNAVVAALDYLEIPIERGVGGVRVASVLPDGPAAGIVEVGDVVVAVGGTPVSSRAEAIETISSRAVDDLVVLDVLREEERVNLNVTLGEHVDFPGQPMVGVGLEVYPPPAEIPFEIEIDRATSGGGPSAGMMYSLGLIDLLTEEDLVGGKIVAGTGTISPDGVVGPIGGIRQKVIAAQDAGAGFILVPEDNYADALTVKGDAVEIFSISTIDEAVEALREAGG
ncbi:MAG: PDZ domain-containing protein [bacterium]|nr:PDZ domain-containing protein [bacterium]